MPARGPPAGCHAEFVTTTLTRAQHLEGLRAAMLAFVRYAERAGLDAPVPTCPDWSVRDLVAHQGMVHRWSAASLRGERVADVDALERAGRRDPDPLEWLRDGAIELVSAIVEAPEDVRTVVFLNDAPPPREFWARRQCHETTVHAADALAAALGRYPRGDETWIDPAVAVDGIDELLTGFLTRPKSRLRTDEPLLLGVQATDTGDAWRMALSPRPAVTERVADVADCEVVVRGTVAGLYLTLWNRADDAEVEGAEDLTWWRDPSAVTWG